MSRYVISNHHIPVRDKTSVFVLQNFVQQVGFRVRTFNIKITSLFELFRASLASVIFPSNLYRASALMS